jgi:hypothetical protein
VQVTPSDPLPLVTLLDGETSSALVANLIALLSSTLAGLALAV